MTTIHQRIRFFALITALVLFAAGCASFDRPHADDAAVPVTPDAAPPDAPPPDAPPPDAAQPSLRSAPFAVTGGGGSARSASYRIQVRVGGAAPTGDATSATNTSHLGVGPFQSTP